MFFRIALLDRFLLGRGNSTSNWYSLGGADQLLEVAHRVFECVKLVFSDVNVLANVNVPEKVWSHSLKVKFRKHGTNPSKQKLSGAIFVRGDVAKSVE